MKDYREEAEKLWGYWKRVYTVADLKNWKAEAMQRKKDKEAKKAAKEKKKGKESKERSKKNV